MSRPLIGIVVNPSARRNRKNPENIRLLHALAPDRVLVRETRSLTEVGVAAREFAGRGVAIWVADGGDGALHWLIHEAMQVFGDSAPEKLPIFVPTGGGTINFVARKTRLRGTPSDIVGALLREFESTGRCKPLELDTLRVRGGAASGVVDFDHLAFAGAFLGVGQQFFDLYYAEHEPGPLSIVAIVARASLGVVASRFGPRLQARMPRATRTAEILMAASPARVRVDGEWLEIAEFSAVNAGSLGINLGGVFRIFPLADSRGRMHLQAGYLSPTEVVRSIPNLLAGRPIRGRDFWEGRGAEMRVEVKPGAALRPILDGERFGPFRWLEVTLGPAIRVARG